MNEGQKHRALEFLKQFTSAGASVLYCSTHEIPSLPSEEYLMRFWVGRDLRDGENADFRRCIRRFCAAVIDELDRYEATKGN